MTAATRTDVPPSWDERATLTTMLDYARATVRAKCAGVSDEDARRAPLPSSPLMTLCGLVNHLRWNEHWWLECMMFGAEDRSPITDDDPDREMRIAVDIPIGQLLDEYDEQARRYRDMLAPHDLDTRSKQPIGSGETVTLRWVLLHLIEETSRHNGHIDLLREMLDGTTGT